MFSSFRRGLLTVLLVSLAFAASPSLTFASHSWNGYHWARTNNPFTLKLGDNVSSVWDAYLVTTSSDWSVSTVLDTTVVAGKTKPRTCRPTSGRVEVCNANYGNNGWLGLAQIWVNGDHIVQAVTKVNDTYFNTSTYNSPAWRQLVMCQEVGHTLGLDHQDENFTNTNLGTCMDYTNDPDGTIYGQKSNEHPNQHDYDELAIIYKHSDSTTTVDQTASTMPPAANQIDFSGPAQWGKLIHSSNDGRIERYMLDFGGGNKVFTFVIWADRGKKGAEGEEQ